MIEPNDIQIALNIIKRSNKILLLPSSPPDGDSIGSALALFFTLKKLGKEATAVCHDPIPDIYKFLHPRDIIKEDVNINRDFIVTLDCSKSRVDQIRYQVEHNKVNIIITPKKGNFNPKDVTYKHGNVKYDLIITVDTGDLEQLGPIYKNDPEIFYSVPVINIDHHASNGYFGKINIVDVSASSTTEILYDFIRKIDEKLIDESIATALLAGIITDTGSFQNANTTPKSLEIAAELVNLGAHQQEIIKNVYKTKELSTLKIWGRVLSKLKFDQHHKILWAILTEKDFEDTKSHPDEAGGIIDDLLTNAPEAEIVVLLKEKKKGLISGSIRTTSNLVDASKMAEMFGGGGHTRAAGFRIETNDVHKTELEIINKIREMQQQRLGSTPVAYLEEPKPFLEKKSDEKEKWLKDMNKKFFQKANNKDKYLHKSIIEKPKDIKEITIEDKLLPRGTKDKDVNQILQESLKNEEKINIKADEDEEGPKYKFGI